jgi:hypothetical protein
MRLAVYSTLVLLLFGANGRAQNFDQRFPPDRGPQPSTSLQDQEDLQQGPLTVVGLLQAGYDVVGTHMLGPKGIIFLKKRGLLYACEIAATGQTVTALRTVNCVPVQ